MSQLRNFYGVYNAVNSGSKLRVVTNFNECYPKIADVLSSYSPTEIMATSNAILFAQTHITTNNPLFLNKVISEQVSYNFQRQTNSVTINTQFVSLPDYQILKSYMVSCPFNKAVKIYS